MKKPIKRILIAVAVVVVAVVGYIGFDMVRTVTQIPEAYAAWDSASLLVEYMETHDGAWPTSWDELFSAARTLPREDRALRGHSTNNLDKIAQLVRIDWTADPQELAQAEPKPDGIPFRVVTRADGSDFPTLWSGAEPNTLIWEYLKEESSNKPSHHTAESRAGARLPASGER